jgi:hypothetical protein
MKAKPGEIVKTGWEGFRKAAITPSAGPVQLSEMEKAFQAGALTVLSAMLSIAEQDLSDESGAMVMESMWQEVRTFAHGLPDNGQGGLTAEEWQNMKRKEGLN